MELGRLQKTRSSFEAAGIRLLAISVDAPPQLKRARNKVGAEFTFLSDNQGQLLDLFGIRHAGGDGLGGDIARSANFLLSPQGEVLWSYTTPNYRVRKKPEEILREVAQILNP